MSKKSKATSDVVQLAMEFGSLLDPVGANAAYINQALEVVVPVESTFDVSQGIREVKTFWHKHRAPMKIIFDCRHLELAQEYISADKNVFEPQESYLIGKGGLINTAVFFNLLRCCMTLETWADQISHQTGTPAIAQIRFEAPKSGTPAGDLWKNLGMPTPYHPPHAQRVSVDPFMSRYITPILWVNKATEPKVLTRFYSWTDDISDRLGPKLRADLRMLAPEVTTNLIKFGLADGFYGVSVWKSGQVEVVWSNTIEHLPDWPPDDTATGLINGLQGGAKGGAGMTYIYDQLLPKYNGLLAINCKGNDLIVHSSRRLSLHSQSSEDRLEFLPTSILFTLQLFCPETRDRS